MSDEGGSGDEQGAAVEAEFDWAEVAPSTAVVETIAVASNRNPRAIDPLFESLDPDALDEILRSPETEMLISFLADGCRVRVDATGRVSVSTVE